MSGGCFSFLLFSVFFWVELDLSRVRYSLYPNTAGHSRLAGVSFSSAVGGALSLGLVECPAGALPLSPAGALSSSLAGTLSSSPAGAHFFEPSRCSFSDTGGLSSSLVCPFLGSKRPSFPKSR